MCFFYKAKEQRYSLLPCGGLGILPLVVLTQFLHSGVSAKHSTHTVKTFFWYFWLQSRWKNICFYFSSTTFDLNSESKRFHGRHWLLWVCSTENSSSFIFKLCYISWTSSVTWLNVVCTRCRWLMEMNSKTLRNRWMLVRETTERVSSFNQSCFLKKYRHRKHWCRRRGNTSHGNIFHILLMIMCILKHEHQSVLTYGVHVSTFYMFSVIKN